MARYLYFNGSRVMSIAKSQLFTMNDYVNRNGNEIKHNNERKTLRKTALRYELHRGNKPRLSAVPLINI